MHSWYATELQTVASGVIPATAQLTVTQIMARRTSIAVIDDDRFVGRVVYGYVGGMQSPQARTISNAPRLVQQWHQCPRCKSLVASGALAPMATPSLYVPENIAFVRQLSRK